MMKQTIAVVLMALGCGGAQVAGERTTTPKGGVSPAGTASALTASCASMDARPVELSYEDSPGGSSLLFETTGSADELRTRVTELARLYNSPESQAETPYLTSIPHSAQVETVDRGAKLILTASATNDADALRKNVLQDVEVMKQNGCTAGHEAL